MIPKIVLTGAGAALLAKTPAGYAVPVTRWQYGKGTLPAGSSLDRTALVDPIAYLPVSQVTNDGDTATVLGQYTNQNVTEAFPFEELGLLAQDPEAGEILMAYGNGFGDGELIQAAAEQLREFVFGAELVFSAAANVTALIDQSLVFIPMAEKGAPGGVAPLGEDGKVPEQYLPELNKLDAAIQVSYNEEVS